jgi:hypothetical protein
MSWINLLSIPFIALLAFGKGRGYIFWSILAFFIGFWAFIPLSMLKVKPMKEIVIPGYLKNTVIANFSRSSMRGINTVDDLLKETPNNS